MGQRKRRNFEAWQSKNGNSNRHIALYFDMYESMAFKELSANEVMLYLRMLSKFTPIYSNNIQISTTSNNISIPKAEYIKMMSQRTFMQSIDHLIELGFVKLVKSQFAEKKCNIYGFNDMWQNYGTDKFYIKDEWKRPKFNRGKMLE